jgi:hypothetical protein
MQVNLTAGSESSAEWEVKDDRESVEHHVQRRGADYAPAVGSEAEDQGKASDATEAFPSSLPQATTLAATATSMPQPDAAAATVSHVSAAESAKLRNQSKQPKSVEHHVQRRGADGAPAVGSEAEDEGKASDATEAFPLSHIQTTTPVASATSTPTQAVASAARTTAASDSATPSSGSRTPQSNPAAATGKDVRSAAEEAQLRNQSKHPRSVEHHVQRRGADCAPAVGSEAEDEGNASDVTEAFPSSHPQATTLAATATSTPTNSHGVESAAPAAPAATATSTPTQAVASAARTTAASDSATLASDSRTPQPDAAAATGKDVRSAAGVAKVRKQRKPKSKPCKEEEDLWRSPAAGFLEEEIKPMPRPPPEAQGPTAPAAAKPSAKAKKKSEAKAEKKPEKKPPIATRIESDDHHEEPATAMAAEKKKRIADLKKFVKQQAIQEKKAVEDGWWEKGWSINIVPRLTGPKIKDAVRSHPLHHRTFRVRVSWGFVRLGKERAASPFSSCLLD